MPAPEPDTIFFEEYDGRLIAYFHKYFWSGRYANRAKRASTMLGRVNAGTWQCKWCGEALWEHKRVDTLYCGEGCRKRAARQRRKYKEKSPNNINARSRVM